MIKQNYVFAALFMAFIFLNGCSSSDDSDPDVPVVFNSLTASKTMAFIEETITLDIDGQGFDDVIVSSSNSDAIITKVSSTTYTVEAVKRINAIISIQLKNNTYTETESITLDFFEHGVKNFNTVEGIKIDLDKTDKVIALLGEPEGKLDFSNNESEFWFYFSKGFSLWIRKETGIVFNSRVHGTTWNATINGERKQGIAYPYEIGNSWKLPNAQLSMDDVIAEMGQPANKAESSSPTSQLKWYVYDGVVFFFNSDSIDNYSGKPVLHIDIF